MRNSIDITAKLLANENINVIKASVMTASFNIETRLLKLPILKDVTDEIEHMLVSHEIGHALFTTQELVDASSNDRKLHSYLNVIEDVRIEKFVKRKYPGTKKIFAEGYKQLQERNFFKLDEIPDINQMGLIDRINMYYKLGSFVNIKFDEIEQGFVDRTAKTETVGDVIKLSKEIYGYAKKQREEKRKQQSKQQSKQIDEVLDENFDIDFEQSETQIEKESEDTSNQTSQEKLESDDDSEETQIEESESDEEGLESITDSAFNDNLQDLVDNNSSIQYHTLDDDYAADYVVNYKRVLSELTATASNVMSLRYYKEFKHDSVDLSYLEFKTGALKAVSYLLKEFEMKKAATAHRRSSVSKSGSLDMKKVWGYQLNEDLFKRVTTVADGKNHGMVFLLDWSGSMSNVIHDAVQQVITLSMFCHRAQIPFQVFAFTDKYYRTTPRNSKNWTDKENTLDNACHNSTLLELYSHKMTTKEFNSMSKLLFNTHNVTSTNKYELGGTPLNSALAFMTDHIGKFIRGNNIEKTSFITLTDGQGYPLVSSSRHQDILGYRKSEHFITDTATKKVYPFSSDSVEQTSTLLQMIKDRYNTTNVGFYIASSTRVSDVASAMYYNGVSNHNVAEKVEKFRTEAKSKGFTNMESKGRDNLFLVPAKSLKIEDKELELNSKSSAKAIANKFGKNLESQQVNRLLLNNFVKLIA